MNTFPISRKNQDTLWVGMWELKDLDDKKYVSISEPLNEVGRMLGGWLRKTEKETPAGAGERRQ